MLDPKLFDNLLRIDHTNTKLREHLNGIDINLKIKQIDYNLCFY